MGRHILFVIHGMGEFEEDWGDAPDGPRTSLLEASQRYDCFGQTPLEQRVDIHTITYADVFKAERDKWVQGAAEIEAVAADYEWISDEAKEAVLGWLEGAGDDKAFFWTHAADVVMYRLIPEYRNAVRIKVIKDLGEKIRATREAEHVARCSILAHSMGTAVAHDCMHLLVSREWGGATNALGPEHWAFESVFMVSNTSRLLEVMEDKVPHPYESLVRPAGAGLEKSSCDVYWNFHHILDGVTWPCAFRPADWGDNYHDVSVSHFHRYDVHGLGHYLKNPKVHAPILRLSGEDVFGGEQEAAAIEGDSFPQFDDEFAEVAKYLDLKTKIEQFRDAQPAEPTLKQWIDGLVGFFKLIGGYV